MPTEFSLCFTHLTLHLRVVLGTTCDDRPSLHTPPSALGFQLPTAQSCWVSPTAPHRAPPPLFPVIPSGLQRALGILCPPGPSVPEPGSYSQPSADGATSLGRPPCLPLPPPLCWSRVLRAGHSSISCPAGPKAASAGLRGRMCLKASFLKRSVCSCSSPD